MKKPFYEWDGDTLVLNILGTPNAKRDAIGKVKGPQLCVSVTEFPRAGRATDHMVRFLAEEFGVSTGDIQVVFGRMNVNKQLRIKAPKRLPSVIASAIGQQELLLGAQSAIVPEIDESSAARQRLLAASKDSWVGDVVSPTGEAWEVESDSP